MTTHQLTTTHPARLVRRRRRLTLTLLVTAVVVAAGVVVLPRLPGHIAPAPSAPTGAAPSTAIGLDPELERRFELAREAAAADGVDLWITSGWRTAAEQQRLVDEAIQRYGSEEEAHRWVLPPEVSAHVSGTAIDVGPTEGALWLDAHGSGFGLCRTYANEVWHFEATIEPGGTCGEMWPDASHGWA